MAKPDRGACFHAHEANSGRSKRIGTARGLQCLWSGKMPVFTAGMAIVVTGAIMAWDTAGAA